MKTFNSQTIKKAILIGLTTVAIGLGSHAVQAHGDAYSYGYSDSYQKHDAHRYDSKHHSSKHYKTKGPIQKVVTSSCGHNCIKQTTITQYRNRTVKEVEYLRTEPRRPMKKVMNHRDEKSLEEKIVHVLVHEAFRR